MLETSYANLFDEVGALQKEVKNKHAELKALVSAESVGLQKQIAEAKALLKDITIGGLGKEVIGWLWLLGSTVLSVLASLHSSG